MTEHRGVGARASNSAHSALKKKVDAVGRILGTNAWRNGSPPSTMSQSIKAGMRGALDSMPFDLGDKLPASYYGLGALLSGRDAGLAYERQLAAEHAQNRYDEAVHPTARTSGKIAGTVVQLLAMPGEAAVLKGGARLAEAAPMMAREWGAITGLGAAAPAAVRGVSDLVRGERSSAADYAGDFVGGGTDALLSRFGLGSGAGAAGGAAGAATTDLVNGRLPSLEHLRREAVVGAEAGATGGIVGRRLSNALKPMEKGRLGERMSIMRTILSGDIPRSGPKRAIKVSGRKTIPDHETVRKMLVEAKFGPKAKLSKGQRAAYEYFGPEGYRVDSFLPRDVGAIAAYPASMMAVHFQED